MKSTSIKYFIVTVALVFLGDAINCDILIAAAANAMFHTEWNSISREVVTGTGQSAIAPSTHSIASTANPPQDEDSPTTLDTSFPEPQNVCFVPDIPVTNTSPVAVHHTYLSLCTLLL